MSLQAATKYCKKCDTEKNPSDFYNNASNKDGRSRYCADCTRLRVKQSQAKRREELGDERYLATRRGDVARFRQTEAGKRQVKLDRMIRTEANRRLRELHRDDYEHLLKIARREAQAELNEVSA